MRAPFIRDQQGATGTEYGLIAALVAVVLIGSATALGWSTYAGYKDVIVALDESGQVETVATASPVDTIVTSSEGALPATFDSLSKADQQAFLKEEAEKLADAGLKKPEIKEILSTTDVGQLYVERLVTSATLDGTVTDGTVVDAATAPGDSTVREIPGKGANKAPK